MSITEDELEKIKKRPGVRQVHDPGTRFKFSEKGKGGPSRNAHAQSEWDEQCRLIGWRDEYASIYPALGMLCSSQAGARMSPAQAGKAKAAGMVRGFPDLSLLVQRRGYAGLFIELKVGDNRLTPEQRAWIKALNREGYYATTCWGAAQAWARVLWYLEIGVEE